MDIACSNRSLRQQLRFLASHPSHRWRHAAGVRTKDASSYMAWLASREVAVKTLYLCEDNAHGITALALQGIRLAHVHELVLQFMGVRDIPVIQAALRLCPNITSIDGFHINTLLPRMCDVLGTFPAMKLKTLKVTNTTAIYYDRPFPWPLLGRRLAASFSQLAALHLFGIIPVPEDILATLSLQCKKLESLAIYSSNISLASILLLVGQCPQLSRLVLDNFTGTVDDIKSIIRAGYPSLKAFQWGDAEDENQTIQLLADFVAEFPWLDLVAIGYHCFVRPRRSLQLGLFSHQVSEDMIANLSAACGHLSILTLSCCGRRAPDIDRKADIVAAVGLHIGSHLEELIVQPFPGDGSEHQLLQRMLSYCPNLKTFTMMCAMTLTDQDLVCVAQFCPLLKVIHLKSDRAAAILVGDAGMEALFAGCPDLKEVHVGHAPNITCRTLQAIVQHKLRLDKFIWLSAGFDEDVYFMLKSKSLERFHELVKEQQLLPILLMEKAEDLKTKQAKRASAYFKDSLHELMTGVV